MDSNDEQEFNLDQYLAQHNWHQRKDALNKAQREKFAEYIAEQKPAGSINDTSIGNILADGLTIAQRHGAPLFCSPIQEDKKSYCHPQGRRFVIDTTFEGFGLMAKKSREFRRLLLLPLLILREKDNIERYASMSTTALVKFQRLIRETCQLYVTRSKELTKRYNEIACNLAKKYSASSLTTEKPLYVDPANDITDEVFHHLDSESDAWRKARRDNLETDLNNALDYIKNYAPAPWQYLLLIMGPIVRLDPDLRVPDIQLLFNPSADHVSNQWLWTD